MQIALSFARLRALFSRRLRSNLASAFAGVLPSARPTLMERSVSALIDGLRLRKSAGDPLGRGAAVATLVAVAGGLLTAAERSRPGQP
jgi:hypothetical protein